MDLPPAGLLARKVEMPDSPSSSTVGLFFSLKTLLPTEKLAATRSWPCTRPLTVMSVRALAAPLRANFFRTTLRPKTVRETVSTSEKQLVRLTNKHRERPRSQGSMLARFFVFVFCPSLGHKNDAEAPAPPRTHLRLVRRDSHSPGSRADSIQPAASAATIPTTGLQQFTCKDAHSHIRDGLSPPLVPSFSALLHFRSAHAFSQAYDSPR